jgi:hypothetical protein
MIADRMINTHNSKIIACTLPNGDMCWISGASRERYNSDTKTTWLEVFYNGKWYIDRIEHDADMTFTPGVGFADNGVDQTTLIESPFQDIN